MIESFISSAVISNTNGQTNPTIVYHPTDPNIRNKPQSNTFANTEQLSNHPAIKTLSYFGQTDCNFGL